MPSNMARVSFADFLSRYGSYLIRPNSSCNEVIDVFRYNQDDGWVGSRVASLDRMQRLQNGVAASYAIHEPGMEVTSDSPIELISLADHFVHAGVGSLFMPLVDVSALGTITDEDTSRMAWDEITDQTELSLCTFCSLHENALVAFEGRQSDDNGPLVAYLLHPESGFVLASLVLERYRSTTTDEDDEESFSFRLKHVYEAPTESSSTTPYRLTREKLDMLQSVSSTAKDICRQHESLSRDSVVWRREISCPLNEQTFPADTPLMTLTRDQFFRLHCSLPHASGASFQSFRHRFGAVDFVPVDHDQEQQGESCIKYKMLAHDDDDDDDRAVQGFLVRRLQHSQFATYTVLGPDDFTIVFESIQLADLYIEYGESLLQAPPSMPEPNNNNNNNNNNNEASLNDFARLHGGLLLDWVPSANSTGGYDVYYARHVHTGRPMYTFCQDQNGANVSFDPLLQQYRPVAYMYANAQTPLMKSALSMSRNGNQKVLRGLSPKVTKPFESAKAKLSRQIRTERSRIGRSLEYEVERRTQNWTQETWLGVMGVDVEDEVGWLNGSPDARRRSLRWIQQSVALPSMQLEDIQKVGSDLKAHVKSTCSVESTEYDSVHNHALRLNRNDLVRSSEGLEAVARGYVNGTTAYEVYGGVTLRQSMYGESLAQTNTSASYKGGANFVHNTINETSRTPQTTEYLNAAYPPLHSMTQNNVNAVIDKTQAHVHAEKFESDANDLKTVSLNAGIGVQRRWVNYNAYTYEWIAYNPSVQQPNSTYKYTKETTPANESETTHSMKGSLNGAFYEKQYCDVYGRKIRFQVFSADLEGSGSAAMTPHNNVFACASMKPVHRCVNTEGKSPPKETTTLETKGSIGFEHVIQNPASHEQDKDNEKFSAKVFANIKAGLSSSPQDRWVEQVGINVDYTCSNDDTTVSVGGNLYGQRVTDSDGRSSSGVGGGVSVRFGMPETRCMRQNRSFEETMRRFDDQLQQIYEQRERQPPQQQQAANLPSLPDRTTDSIPSNMVPSGGSSSKTNQSSEGGSEKGTSGEGSSSSSKTNQSSEKGSSSRTSGESSRRPRRQSPPRPRAPSPPPQDPPDKGCGAEGGVTPTGGFRIGVGGTIKL